MISFNGVTLENIAPVKIVDINVYPIKYSATTRSRAIQYGSEFIRMHGGERTIAVTFAILDSNMMTRRQALDAVCEWAKTDAEYRLMIGSEMYRYLTCVCTSRPEPSTRQWWESKLKIVFTCYNNPYWNSVEEKSVACGTAFTALGDAPPLMRIERTVSGSAASNQTYSNGAQSMTFSTIPVGNMVIDLNRQTAAVGGTSIMQYYQPSGSFIIPKTGVQTITGTGTVKYRERHE